MLELVAFVLLICIAAGLLQLLRAPSMVERMMVAQLLSTVGVGLILVLAAAGRPEGIWVALVLALLAAIAGVTFVRRHACDPATKGGSDA